MPVGIKEKEYAEGSNSRKAEPSIEKKVMMALTK